MVNRRSVKAFCNLKAIFTGMFRCKKDRLGYFARKENPKIFLSYFRHKLLLRSFIVQKLQRLLRMKKILIPEHKSL